MVKDDDEERRPLLANDASASNDTERPSVDPAQFDGTAVLRMLLALRGGQMPDNRQLNTILQASASFLDTLSHVVTPQSGSTSSSSKYGSTQQQADGQGAGNVLSNETTITLAAMLMECSTFARSMAEWLKGDDGETHEEGEKNGVRGNANEQWQRLLWHLGQVLSNETEFPVQVDVEGDVGEETKRMVNETTKVVKQAGVDAATGFKSVVKMIALVVGSDELLRIPSDILRHVQTNVADVAAEIAARAEVVDEKLRPPAAGEEEEEIPFSYPADAVRETFEATTNALDAATTQQKGKGRQDADEEKETWQDELARRISRLLEELKQDEGFTRAANTFISLARKYMEMAKELRDDIQTKAQTEGEGVTETLETTIKSTKLDVQLDAHLSHHATQAGQALKEVLEGLAGGTSLDVLLERVNKVKHEIQSDSELRIWFDDLLDCISNTINSKSEQDTEQTLKTLFSRLMALLETRPAVQRSWEDVRRSADQFQDALRSNTDTRRLRARLQHIASMGKTVFVRGVRDAKEQTRNAFSTLIHALLPSLGQILGKIPLPRVEFASEKLDAALDDIHIGALSLLPDSVRLTTTNDWTWNRQDITASQVDTDLRISLSGLRLAVEDVSFYVQERYTAPDPASCFSCCSCGHSKSGWCLFRGPSSWLAYTEKALLDFGFVGKGAGIVLDIRDAGQDLRKEETSWWPFARSKSPDKGRAAVEREAKQYETFEIQQEREEQSKRTTFFDVNECKVDVDEAFEFRLRNSRHWLINAVLGASIRPMIRLLLRRIVAAQIKHAFVAGDGLAYDLYRRAKLVQLKRSSHGQLDEIKPGLRDFIAVIFDDNAGKSKARLAKEREERRREEEEARKKEDEESEERLERAADPNSEQPRKGKSMEVKRTGFVMHDEDGEFSIAVGIKPSGLLLKPDQRGPPTQRTRIRQALANPKQTASDARLYGHHIKDVSAQRLLGDYDGDDDDDRDLLEVPKKVTRKAKNAVEAVQDFVHAEAPEVAIEDDQGWKTEAFDV